MESYLSYDWLVSLMSSGFICVVVCVRISFLFRAAHPIVCICRIVSSWWTLGLLPLLAVVNAAMNIVV